MPSPIITNPHYGPCPRGIGNIKHIKMIDAGEKCVFDDTPFVDGHTYYCLPCKHYFCGNCIRKMRRVTTEGFITDDGCVETRLRCFCGRRYGEEEIVNATPFRALVRGQVIELTDDYVSVKQER